MEWEGTSLVFKTCAPVSVGEELCICYVEPDWPLSRRQTYLKSSFYFDCTCPLCSQQMEEHKVFVI